MKIAIYVRVSTERQADQGASVEDQIAQIDNWAKRENHTVVQVFREEGASAFDDRRPIFQIMIESALAPDKPFDAIVVHTSSRFYRDNVLRALITRKLERGGIKVISLTQPLPDDASSAYLLENIIGLIDEFQSRENSKHVIRCQRRNAEDGFFNGSRPPYGYQTFLTDLPARNGVKKRLVPEPSEAVVVKRIFQMADEGFQGVVQGAKRIANFLNQSGQRNRGKNWRKQHIHEILTNTAYFGERITFRTIGRTHEIRPKDEWVICKIPPIIDRELFDRVHGSLQSRQLKNVDAKSTQVSTLLTGLLKCAQCKRNLTLRTGKTGRYNYYGCSTKSDFNVAGCNCPNIRREPLESAILDVVANVVLQPDRVARMMSELREAINKMHEPEKRRLLSLQRDASLQDERISLLYDQAGSGKLDLDSSLQEYLRVQQRKLSTMRQEIKNLESRQSIPLKKFGPQQIDKFSEAVKSELLNRQSPLARQYLRAVVSEIRIKKATAELIGSKAQLAAAISNWTPQGTLKREVPSFVSNWRA